MDARRCTFCGGAIPLTRRRHSKYCTDRCKRAYKDARFAQPGKVEHLPGSYLLAMQAEGSGLVYVSFTYRLNQRIRLARACCSEPLTIIGIVQADDARATRFRTAHAQWRTRASWYQPAPEVIGYFTRRTIAVAHLAAAQLSAEGEQEHRSAVPPAA